MSTHLFLIYSCSKYLHKAERIYNKINNKLINCKVYIIYGNIELKSEYEIVDDKYLVLNVEDTYEYLNKKTYFLFHTINILYPNISGVFKCDDDIVPNITFLNNFLNNNKNIDYCGKTIIIDRDHYSQEHISKVTSSEFKKPTLVPVCVYCGGPLYYLSDKSINVFSNKITDVFFEDAMVGLNLNYNNIFPNNIDLYTDDISLSNYTSFHNSIHDDNISINLCDAKK